MAKDALAAHARDELGINELSEARPLQAAVASALTFAGGAVVPLVTAVLSPPRAVIYLLPGFRLWRLPHWALSGRRLAERAF